MRDRKLEIITRLRYSIPEALQEPTDQAMITWWANIRDRGGMRLTHHGYQILHDVLGMECWCLDLPIDTKNTITKKMILDMDRKLQWPYYIDINPRKRHRRVVFFSSREAMMANLYGDLEQWLRSLY
jgi:hypothetical protein